MESPPASPADAAAVATFPDLPEDVQLSIFSFLIPSEVSSLACTSRRFASLPSSASLWLAMCLRRWGSHTSPSSWVPHSSLRRLYRTLDRWENLIGFWRRIGHGSAGSHSHHPLIFFQWGASSISGSYVSPSPDLGSYNVVKIPFLWLGLSKEGEPISFRQTEESDSDGTPFPVSVSFMGDNHLVVEESGGCWSGEEDLAAAAGIESGSPPDRVMLEIYQYFANRTSPGGEKGLRKQRRRERQRKKGGWEAEHFVKIRNYFPTPARPLQGLWKGISEYSALQFYLVSYDDIGGITCRRVGEPGGRFFSNSPVFWTLNTQFLEPPFSEEEQDLYASREPLEGRIVSRILCINSSYELIIPDLSGSSDSDSRNMEGRIWEYDDGTFGFGFFRNDYITNLKRVALDGDLLDCVNSFANSS